MPGMCPKSPEWFDHLQVNVTKYNKKLKKQEMNKIRIIGLVIFIIAVITQLSIENDMIDFFSAVFIGIGIGLLYAGKTRN